jgi:hypothetical protein
MLGGVQVRPAVTSTALPGTDQFKEAVSPTILLGGAEFKAAVTPSDQEMHSSNQL